MKTVCKKLLSLMLVAVLLVSAVPMMANAAETCTFQLVTQLLGDGTSIGSGAKTVTTNSTVDLNAALVAELIGSYNSCLYDINAWWTEDGSTPVSSPVTMDGDKTVMVELKKKDVPTHNYSWKVTTPATIDAEGVETGTCSACGATTTRAISKLESVTLTFQSGLQYENTTTKKVQIGAEVELPTPASVSGYEFDGWFTGSGTQLKAGTTASSGMDTVYYAQYHSINKVSSDSYHVYLNIYFNTNLTSYAKQVQIDSLAADGVVSLGEAKNVVKNYYNAKDSNGIGYDGLYEGNGDWVQVYKDDKPQESIEGMKTAVANGNVYLNVVISNAVAKSSSSSSSSNADSSNPKTGDSIYTAVAVMGLSVTALAAVYYINKKRMAY